MFEVFHTILKKPELSTRNNEYPASSFTSLDFARARPFLSLIASKVSFIVSNTFYRSRDLPYQLIGWYSNLS